MNPKPTIAAFCALALLATFAPAATADPATGPPVGFTCVGGFNQNASLNVCTGTCQPGQCTVSGLDCVYLVGNVCLPVFPQTNPGHCSDAFPRCLPAIYVDVLCNVASFGFACHCDPDVAPGIVFVKVCSGIIES